MKYFMHACRYSHLLPLSFSLEQTRLGKEFIQYQLLSKEDIPTEVWDAACVWSSEEDNGDEVEKFYRMDVVWHHLANLKGGHGRLIFPRLSKVAKLVLTLPHSNAAEERVFSIVHKNKTSFRPNLSLDTTLRSLLTVKLATHGPCFKIEPAEEVVRRAGKVTWEYNKKHSKTT